MMQEYCNRMDVERTQTSSSSSSSSSNAEWKQWSWADRIYNKRTKEWIPDPQSRFHPVPKGWRLPNAPIANLWYAWWHGDKVLKIRPYQFISRLDISVDPSIDRGPADRLDWGRCIIVMKYIHDKIKTFDQRDLNTLSQEETYSLCHQALTEI